MGIATCWAAAMLALVVGHVGRVGRADAQQAPDFRSSLQPCMLPGFEKEVLCGEYRVWEDRSRRSGRRIPLRVAVLPARGAEVRPDPVFFLEGGPGVSSVEFAARFRDHPVRDRREVVLVDARGSGGSNALRCPWQDGTETLQADLDGVFADPDLWRSCREHLEGQADLKRYTTPNIADDLDEVRSALGYERINLFGYSHGSRIALVYLRRHGEHVRTTTLLSAAPLAYRNPLPYARAAQAALDLTFAECRADPACHAAFPDPEGDFRRVLTRLEAGSAPVEVEHPDTGERATVRLSRTAFTEIVRLLLYELEDGRRVPRLVRDAAEGRFEELTQIGLDILRGGRGYVAWGQLLSVTCSEDVLRIDPGEVADATRGTFTGPGRVRGQMEACGVWDSGRPAPDYGRPVTSSVPVLVVSGRHDPVTPPEWGREAARHFEHALHVVLPGGHGVREGSVCWVPLLAEFLERGSVEGLDTGCGVKPQVPPFDVGR